MKGKAKVKRHQLKKKSFSEESSQSEEVALTESQKKGQLFKKLIQTGGYVCYKSTDPQKPQKQKNGDQKDPNNNSTSGTLVTDASQNEIRVTEVKDLMRPAKKKRKLGHLMHLAYVLSLTNIISFPTYCGKYGGGVFLIPFVISYIVVGVPLLYVEMALGQFASISPVEIFRRISPALSGLAVSVIAIDFYKSLFLSSYMTASTYLATRSLNGLTSNVTWNSCHNGYNTRVAKRCNSTTFPQDEECDQFWRTSREISSSMFKMWTPPYLEYVTGTVFKSYFKASELEFPQFDMIWILGLVWALIGLFSVIGLRSIGNGFVYMKIFTVIVVFVNMCLSIITGRTGGGGINFLFLPNNYTYLLKPDIWSNAVSCVVSSLNVGTGTIHRISAFSDFNDNFLLDAIIVCTCDLIFSLAIGTTVFASLGSVTAGIYGAADAHTRIHQMYRQGSTLVWTIFPEHIYSVWGDHYYTYITMAVHYFNFFLLGIPGLVVNVILIRNALNDVVMGFSSRMWYHESIRHFFLTVLVIAFGYVLSLVLVHSTGMYLSRLWYQSTATALMATCLIELVAIIYGYGFTRFFANIETMLLGRQVEVKYSNTFLKPLFYLVTPLCLVYSVIVSATTYRILFGSYLYPISFEAYGRFIFITCILPIPATLLCHLYKLRNLGLIGNAFEPRVNWGPASAEHRERNTIIEKAAISRRQSAPSLCRRLSSRIGRPERPKT